MGTHVKDNTLLGASLFNITSAISWNLFYHYPSCVFSFHVTGPWIPFRFRVVVFQCHTEWLAVCGDQDAYNFGCIKTQTQTNRIMLAITQLFEKRYVN